MNKHELMPNVLVYRDVFENINDVVDLIKKTEEDSNLIGAWENWSALGKMKLLFLHDLDNYSLSNSQKYIISEIYDSYYFVLKDYIKTRTDFKIWPDYIKNWNLNSNNNFIESEIGLLKHDASNEDLLAMHYHTDSHEWDKESAGKHFMITVTIYPNDDYDNGEISFFKEDTKEILKYKPKAGDIVVFPSVWPYFHGVYPAKKHPKYLIRMFLFYNYEGSNEWHNNLIKYGKEEWLRMEEENFKKEFESGNWHRYIYTKNEDPIINNRSKTVIVNEIKYLNGKDLK